MNQNVTIHTAFGSMKGSGTIYKGVVTDYDDEFVCLDNKTYIVRKFIMTIKLK